LGDKQFGGLIPTKDIEARLKEFERKFASFGIRNSRGAIHRGTTNKQYVPQDMYARTKKKILAENIKGIRRDLCEQLTIGECATIVEYGDIGIYLDSSLLKANRDLDRIPNLMWLCKL
jgi:hypothetical protein